MGNWHNWLSSWAKWWNIIDQRQPNPTQLSEEMDHPALPFWSGDDPLEGSDSVVEDLEDADEAEAHAESEESAGVGDEGDHRDLLVAHYLRHNRVLKRRESRTN